MGRNEIKVGRIYTSLATGTVVFATYNIRPVAVNGLRPAGGDPWVDRPQKYFFDGLCFFEWTWPFWTPLKGFREEALWFKLRKTRRKVAPFLTPLGAARAACSADWLKIDMWENPSFDSSGSRQLVGTLQYALALSSDMHFNSRSSLACLSSACISLGMLLKAKFTPAVSSVQSLTPPPPLSLSLSPCDQINVREKESLPLNTTIRTSKRKFAKCGHQVQVSRAPTASMQCLIQKN